jgi:hypothetical protein
MRELDQPGCVEVFGLSQSQIAALRFHGGLEVVQASGSGRCPWRLVAAEVAAATAVALDMRGWRFVSTIRRPVDAKDNLLLYRKAAAR